MDRLLTPDDVARVLQVSRRTAYSIMHQMPHLERPFRVTESALWAWMAARTINPTGKKKTPVRALKFVPDRIPRRKEA